MDWRKIASGIALIIAASSLVVLHKLNYSREHQLYSIALVGAFGFLFLSRHESQQDQP
jgi:hypothetical protein